MTADATMFRLSEKSTFSGLMDLKRAVTRFRFFVCGELVVTGFRTPKPTTRYSWDGRGTGVVQCRRSVLRREEGEIRFEAEIRVFLAAAG